MRIRDDDASSAEKWEELQSAGRDSDELPGVILVDIEQLRAHSLCRLGLLAQAP